MSNHNRDLGRHLPHEVRGTLKNLERQVSYAGTYRPDDELPWLFLLLLALSDGVWTEAILRFDGRSHHQFAHVSGLGPALLSNVLSKLVGGMAVVVDGQSEELCLVDQPNLVRLKIVLCRNLAALDPWEARMIGRPEDWGKDWARILALRSGQWVDFPEALCPARFARECWDSLTVSLDD